jgi:hypothetical protein
MRCSPLAARYLTKFACDANMTQELLTSLTAGCILSFGWAIRPGRSPFVILAGLVTAAIHLPAIWIGASWLGGWAALPLVASWMLFWWAMDAQARQRLSSQDRPLEGPYRWVRHPFYVAYMLTWISGPLASGSPLLFVTAGLWGVFYVASAYKTSQRSARIFGLPLTLRSTPFKVVQARCASVDLTTYQVSTH